MNKIAKNVEKSFGWCVTVGKAFYKFAPAVLATAGFVFGVNGYLMHVYVNARVDLVLWLFVASIQLLMGLACGRLIQRLHHDAYMDSLTGLHNRCYFYEKITEELERLKRTKAPLSLSMIDVDDFKSVNDTYGHLKGDEVLQQLASIFLKSIRAIDTIARWGGEEFAIILPGTSTEGATAFAERLRINIDTYDFGYGRVTISVGVISASEGMDVNRLMMLADEALYNAKKKKNVVVSRCNAIHGTCLDT